MTAIGRLRGLVLGLLLAASAVAVSPEAADAEPAGDPAIAAFVAGDCNRCHTVPGVADAPRPDSCAGCHTWIRQVAADPVKRARAVEIFPQWPRYEQVVASFLDVPRLDAAMARLDPAWVRRYLADPHDLRPNLPETMPRLGLSDAELDAIAAAFARAQARVPTTPAPTAARAAEGERLFVARGCAGCHTFGGRHTSGAAPLAPDLAHTRARMSPDHAAAWIRDPAAVSPSATMPALGLTEAEALALRDYLWLADPRWTPAAAMGPLPPATARPVAWAEVEERVFGRICRHCHMNPEANQGRAGPGNAGGFGWPATGIDLETYEGVVAARSRIIDALVRRRAEGSRDAVAAGEQPAALTRPPRPGMPLGLPPLSDEDTALVLGWLEQGAPR